MFLPLFRLLLVIQRLDHIMLLILLLQGMVVSKGHKDFLADPEESRLFLIPPNDNIIGVRSK